MVMKSIVRAMKPLMQILFLILFIIVIYAIIGLELLVGRFHSTCKNITTGRIIQSILHSMMISVGMLTSFAIKLRLN